MKRLNVAPVAAFATAVLAFSLAFPADAQINGAPPSVTSVGFGGTPGSIHGAAPSVTSLGPRGYTPGYSPFPSGSSLFGVNSGHNISGHGHPRGGYYPWGGYYYAVPYYGYGYDDSSYNDPPPPDDQYNGGPTVFDRRGPGGPDQAPRPISQPAPAQAEPSEAAEVASAVAASPTVAQPETVLVFKDGHQLEVENYAIIGNTLYDLTEGRRHKIGLDDLDLTATAKQNEDRGVDFEIPASAAN